MFYHLTGIARLAMQAGTSKVDVAKIEGSFEAMRNKKASVSKHGMVATAFGSATKAGVEMLRKGGNAVDAACAASLALGVCEPQASGIGGQTIAIIHIDGKTIGVDGSSRVPSLAHPSAFTKNARRLIGYKAATVPSTMMTIGYLNEHYGRLDWQTIIKPAIRIARRGYRITKLQHDAQADNLDKFFKVGSRSGARYFLKDGQAPYDAGDLFVQEDLAELLLHLGTNGYRSFYCGEIADKIDHDMKKNKGYIRKEDLVLLSPPVERRPISKKYRGVQVYSTPPPGAGDTMLLVMMMLGTISKKRLKKKNFNTYRYISETFRKVLLHRSQNPSHPDTYGQTGKMHLNAGFARELARSTMAGPLSAGKSHIDLEDTTHLSVMDDNGNAVSMTQSIELVYGSKAAADGLGFLYNNYISTMEFEDQSHPFYLRPGSIPWSAVCPSIVFYNHVPWIAVGSTGSTRIFSTVSMFLSRLFDEEGSIYTATEGPRMHCSLAGKVTVEEDDSWAGLAEYLKRMGYETDIRERYSFYMGAMHAVLKCQDGEGFQGVADVRRDGTAEGPP